jgi:hypothetical protein
MQMKSVPTDIEELSGRILGSCLREIRWNRENHSEDEKTNLLHPNHPMRQANCDFWLNGGPDNSCTELGWRRIVVVIRELLDDVSQANAPSAEFSVVVDKSRL